MSVVTLIFYLAFTLVELPLYSSLKVDSKIPWSRVHQSSDYLISIGRTAIRVILVASFVFDKQGSQKPKFLLTCLGLLLYLLLRGFTDSMYVNNRI